MTTGLVLMVKLIWISLVILILGLFILAYPYYYETVQEVCESQICNQFQLMPSEVQEWQRLGFGLDGYATYTTLIAYLAFAACWLVAVGIYWRQSESRIAVFASFDFLLFPTVFLLSQLEPMATAIPFVQPIVRVLQATGIGLLIVFFFLFPNGRFIPRWTWTFALLAGLYCLALLLTSDVIAMFNLIPLLGQVYFWGFIVFIAVGFALQIYRYRSVSSLHERQQTKWVILGLAVVTSITLAYSIWPIFFPTLRRAGILHILYLLAGGTLNVLTFLFFLGCLALSVLRYHLWDIDIIIRKTLVYTLLTTSLAIIFFGSVTLLQSVVSSLIGQQSALATVLSTLAIAALFNPLRRCIQNVIDRRFYRRKYDAQQVLAAFAQTARDEVAMEALGDELLRVVEETMQPAHVSLWLRETK